MTKHQKFIEFLPPDRLEKQFSDAKPLYTDLEAILEAHRCLNCYHAPCVDACPTGINIPKFIKQIASGNLRGSGTTIFEANMLGSSTARVCPVEELCVGACVYNDLNHHPIQIGRLQRYATEKALELEDQTGNKLFVPTGIDRGKKVALIGAGPASLTCAAYLALEGISPTIFEKNKLPGGLNTTAVAPYKFQVEDCLREVKWILSHGVELKTGVEIGKDISLEQLVEEYDAVFIGIGLGKDGRLHLPGGEGDGVWGALELIGEIKNNPDFSLPLNLNTVLVIGGGNTAIDIARELAMLEIPNVNIVYRRTRAEMPGYPHELEGASKYGVRMMENLVPVDILRGEGNRIRALQVTSKQTGKVFELPCDWVVEAIGQESHALTVSSQIAVDEKGCIIVDPQTKRTKHPKVYAGGDCINGGKEVVNAVADGREAAFAMLQSWGIESQFVGGDGNRSFF